MSEAIGDRLYNLLPTLYRLRDRVEGEPLRALLGVIEAEYQLLEEDIYRLYDNWFIETCEEWVVPYIGDLLSVRGLIPVQDRSFSQRALVANTLAYRRGKGTAAVLEQLSRDMTGWSARVVEFFERLITTQYLNHIRISNLSTLDLRQTNQLELLNSPFEVANHTADVRHIDNNRGKYNIPHVGIFLWRLQSYYISQSTARAVQIPSDGRYTFNALGYSLPLFNLRRTETDIAQLAAEPNVPAPLRRRPLYDEVESRRQAVVDNLTQTSIQQLYFSDRPVLRIFFDDVEVQPEEIAICNLGDPPTPIPLGWYRPAANQLYQPSGGGANQTRPIRVGVDPVLGRLALPAGAVLPKKVEISYAYGFAGDLGGGPYDRRESVARWFNPRTETVNWQMGVTQSEELLNETPAQLVSSFRVAVEQWNTYVSTNPESFGLIVILDNSTYDLGEPDTIVPEINLPAGSKLAIASADWVAVDDPNIPGGRQRIVGNFIPQQRRAHLKGNLSVRGTAASIDPGELILDGLLLEGSLRVLPGNLGSLHLTHSTLVPQFDLTVDAETTVGKENQRLSLTLYRSICGQINLAETVPTLKIKDSIVDNNSGEAIAAPEVAADIEESTIIGTTQVRTLEASNSIFTNNFSVIRRQTGCVRFCYLPANSLAPRRYRCQPTATTSQVFPQFTSLTYGHPGYGQLATSCPSEITAGAEDEGEMGAFHFLQQTQRIKNLKVRLDEYLRFGLEAGIFFVN
ncbi:hypothetical protein JYQ62_12060 [Nostoc sp. UHCC 0702]|nr:hypothetical protein JYQ62_12060 [Nostoc sp. UHCC 0702]